MEFNAETKKFGGMTVSVQNWRDRVIYINLIGEEEFGKALRAGRYFWELVYKYSEILDPSGKVSKWISEEADRFDADYMSDRIINSVAVHVRNGENDMIGPYTRISFTRHEG